MIFKIVFRYILIITTPIFLFATCRKNSNSETISGKIIYRSCATTAVQITDPAYFNLGQESWEQTPGQATISNVFAVSNPCQLPQLDSGEVFKFKVLPSGGKTDCITCMMYDNPPTKKLMIQVIK